MEMRLRIAIRNNFLQRPASTAPTKHQDCRWLILLTYRYSAPSSAIKRLFELYRRILANGLYHMQLTVDNASMADLGQSIETALRNALPPLHQHQLHELLKAYAAELTAPIYKPSTRDLIKAS
jgi:hypothetical protein